MRGEQAQTVELRAQGECRKQLKLGAHAQARARMRRRVGARSGDAFRRRRERAERADRAAEEPPKVEASTDRALHEGRSQAAATERVRGRKITVRFEKESEAVEVKVCAEPRSRGRCRGSSDRERRAPRQVEVRRARCPAEWARGGLLGGRRGVVGSRHLGRVCGRAHRGRTLGRARSSQAQGVDGDAHAQCHEVYQLTAWLPFVNELASAADDVVLVDQLDVCGVVVASANIVARA